MDDNNQHDHAAPTHKMECLICGEELLVHAHDDEEAVGLIMQAGKVHFEEAEHSEDEEMDPEEMEKMTKENIEKVQ